MSLAVAHHSTRTHVTVGSATAPFGPSLVTEVTTELERELRLDSDASKRAWWSNYVKGTEFYGVTMADTCRISLAWCRLNRAGQETGLRNRRRLDDA